MKYLKKEKKKKRKNEINKRFIYNNTKIFLIKNKNISESSSNFNNFSINDNFVKMVSNLWFKKDYIVKCLEKNELNQALLLIICFQFMRILNVKIYIYFFIYF